MLCPSARFGSRGSCDRLLGILRPLCHDPYNLDEDSVELAVQERDRLRGEFDLFTACVRDDRMPTAALHHVAYIAQRHRNDFKGGATGRARRLA